MSNVERTWDGFEEQQLTWSPLLRRGETVGAGTPRVHYAHLPGKGSPPTTGLGNRMGGIQLAGTVQLALPRNGKVRATGARDAAGDARDKKEFGLRGSQ